MEIYIVFDEIVNGSGEQKIIMWGGAKGVKDVHGILVVREYRYAEGVRTCGQALTIPYERRDNIQGLKEKDYAGGWICGN